MGHTDLKTAAAVIGGPALFLLGTLVFKLAVFRRWSHTRIVGLMVLAALVPAAEPSQPAGAVGVDDAGAGRCRRLGDGVDG
jgi:low temperature requirement protein LtrA